MSRWALAEQRGGKMGGGFSGPGGARGWGWGLQGNRVQAEREAADWDPVERRVAGQGRGEGEPEGCVGSRGQQGRSVALPAGEGGRNTPCSQRCLLHKRHLWAQAGGPSALRRLLEAEDGGVGTAAAPAPVVSFTFCLKNLRRQTVRVCKRKGLLPPSFPPPSVPRGGCPDQHPLPHAF